MRYDVILYDFDGTLADTVPMIVKSFRIAYREVLGREEDEAFLLSTIGLPLQEAFRRETPDAAEKLLIAYKAANAALLETEVKIFDGITDGLSILRDMGVRQAVVTSKRREPALFTMKQFALEPYFELLIAREDTDSHKPNPEPIFAAAERLGQKDLSRVLYVGDSVHDLRCANNAGVDAAAVEWTYMPREELVAEKPKYWLSRLSDLSCILSDTEL